MSSGFPQDNSNPTNIWQDVQYSPEDFRELFELNKIFVNHKTSNRKRNEKCSFGKGQFNNATNGLNPENCASLPKQMQEKKVTKIGNFNIYNRCVFFVNNTNDESYSECSLDVNTEDFVKNVQNVKMENPECRRASTRDFASSKGLQKCAVDNNKNYLSNGPETECISTMKQNFINSSSQKTYTIFYLENNYNLRPVLSPNIKSGVYRRYSPAGEHEIPANASYIGKNVFLSPMEKHGKILPTEKFHNMYAEAQNYIVNSEDDAAIVGEQFEGISYLDENYEKQQSKDPNEETISNSSHVTMQSSEPSSNKAASNNYSKTFLSEIAFDVLKLPQGDNVTFNITNNEIIYTHPRSKGKITYRVICPDSLKYPSLDSDNSISSSASKTPLKITFVEEQKSKRGRPRKSTVPTPNPITTEEIFKSPTMEDFTFYQPPISTARTRYGRITKPPKHVDIDYEIEVTPEKSEIENTVTDTDYTYKKDIVPNIDCSDEPRIKRIRNLPPENQCKVCNKIYLGKRMQKHFELYPDHNLNNTNNKSVQLNELSLYSFLVQKIKDLPEENQADVFLTEISDFVYQLQSRSSNFVRNTSGTHFVNSRASKVLGIPEGQYSIDLNEIDCVPDPRTRLDEQRNMIIPPPPPRLDYNLSISLDDTINDVKLNLGENIITSEDSLLRTVDDLMKEGIKTLQGHDSNVQNPVINYDHASDNAVEAISMKETQQSPILDLSLDLFQFNSN